MSPRITGKVMSQSDVMGYPDQPLNTWVIVFKKNFFESWLDTMGIEYSPKLALPMKDETFLNNVVAKYYSNADGGYDLELEPGKYYLGLANFNKASTEPIPPAFIWGAVYFSIEAEQILELNLLWTFSGLKKINSKK